MRFLVSVVLPLLLGAQMLELPVRYNPFGGVQIKQKHKKVDLRVPRSTPRPRLVLTAIFGDRAMVGGKMVRVGDRIGGYRVVAIEDAKVILASGKKRKILYFQKPLVRMERR